MLRVVLLSFPPFENLYATSCTYFQPSLEVLAHCSSLEEGVERLGQGSFSRTLNLQCTSWV